ncbi:MAG: AI-2E family transporter [Bacteroidetes bacterium]|nr:AI-2E family transporter [Bacteroidota bacterium]
MNQPFYIKLSHILVSISIILIILFVGQHIFIPIFLSLLFAVLLNPCTLFLNKHLKIPYIISALISVFFFILIIAGIIVFVSWEMGDIINDWRSIKANISLHYHNIQQWVKQNFNISYRKQEKYIQQASAVPLSPDSELMGQTLNSISDLLFNFILIPIYTFLFLLYKNLFMTFLHKLVKPEQKNKLRDILHQIKLSIQSYLVGLMVEMVIVSALTSVGLMLIGVEYAILLGVITGVLNLIPYIGILVAALLSVVATLTGSNDISVIAGVLIVNVIVQLIDNNVLVPMIVSSKVKINALASIICIIIGGAIAGIAGMFMAIPISAILKVIFDRIEPLKPWGYLLGDWPASGNGSKQKQI